MCKLNNLYVLDITTTAGVTSGMMARCSLVRVGRVVFVSIDTLGTKFEHNEPAFILPPEYVPFGTNSIPDVGIIITNTDNGDISKFRIRNGIITAKGSVMSRSVGSTVYLI